jgi:hypothetical protein
VRILIWRLSKISLPANENIDYFLPSAGTHDEKMKAAGKQLLSTRLTPAFRTLKSQLRQRKYREKE